MKHFRITIGVLIICFVLVNAQTQWVRYSGNLVFRANASFYEARGIGSPSLLVSGDTLHLFYAAGGADTRGRILYAYSPDGVQWHRFNQGKPVLDVGEPGQWDSHFLDTPDIIRDDQGFKLYYFGDTDNDPVGGAIGVAQSADGIHWQRFGDKPVLTPGEAGEWDGLFIESPAVIFAGNRYWMLYSGVDTTWRVRIGLATSADGIHWQKYPGNPVIDVGTPNDWNGFGVATPTLWYGEGQWMAWYCGVSVRDWLDNNQIDTIYIGFSHSTNGLDWIPFDGNPVFGTYFPLYSPEEIRGPWAPDVVYLPQRNLYVMMYETAHGFGLAYSTNNALPSPTPEDSRLHLSPNPATRWITLNAVPPGDAYRIFNIRGQLVAQGTVPPLGRVNISHLTPGIYWIVVDNNTGQFVKY